MVQCVKGPTASPDNLSSVAGSTWWKERTNHWGCSLTSTCVPRHAHTCTHNEEDGGGGGDKDDDNDDDAWMEGVENQDYDR